MHCSMFAACLVLVVAVCDVSAQWSGRGLGSVGVVSLDDCNCRLGDVCVQRPRGRMMCRRTTGGFYTPLGPHSARQVVIGDQALIGGQAVIGGQGFVRSGLVNQGLVSRRQLGQAIVDQGLVGAGLLVARQGAVQACCHQRDMFTCEAGRLGNSYIGGGSCNRYYFDGKRCHKLSVNTECLRQLRPRNMFDSAEECATKCGGLGY